MSWTNIAKIHSQKINVIFQQNPKEIVGNLPDLLLHLWPSAKMRRETLPITASGSLYSIFSFLYRVKIEGGVSRYGQPDRIFVCLALLNQRKDWEEWVTFLSLFFLRCDNISWHKPLSVRERVIWLFHFLHLSSLLQQWKWWCHLKIVDEKRSK